jgi:hypothetical protein
MAIVNEKSLVKFGYGVASKAVTEAGHITFASDTRQLFVGDGSTAVAFAGNVANAVFADKKLTITYNDGTATAVLDFSDVASAGTVSSLLGNLRKDVETNKTSISTETAERKAADDSLSERITNLDTAYKAADTTLSERIAKFESGDNSVAKQIENAIDGLDSTANTDNNFFKLEVVEENGKVTGVNFENKDIASASDLSDVSTLLGEVKTTAEAARTEEEVNTQITTKINALGGSESGADASSFVTVTVQTTAGEVSGVTVVGKDIASAATLADVKGRLDTFLKDASLESTVDTLKEIQDWINGDGVDATELTQAIAQEADLRAKADASIRNDFAAADSALDASLKSYVDGKVDGKFDASGAAAAALESAKSYSDGNLATAKTYAEGQATAAKNDAISTAAGDATSKANTAESNAKGYADTKIAAITVNGVVIKDASLEGVHIKVGGTGNHNASNIDVAIEDLYTKVQAASEAGVQSLAVNTDSSNYAEVSGATGAVTLKIKKVALADASATNTGVADAWDVKESIRVAKEGAISTVQGAKGDASTAATVAGAKVYAKEYADAQIEANALRWTVLS